MFFQIFLDNNQTGGRCAGVDEQACNLLWRIHGARILQRNALPLRRYWLIPYFCAKVERINFLVQKEGILTRKKGVNRVESGEF